jgi:signal transduction histidine kinase
VVSNLLENAARHAPAQSTVWIRARPADDHLEIEVTDEGLGVPEFERERIFEPFRRGEGSRSSGIGLAICKAIVEAHGGTIVIGGLTGQGARFVFTLPVRPAATEVGPVPSEPRRLVSGVGRRAPAPVTDDAQPG